MSAQEVVERAQLAQSTLLDGLGPNTTLHVVEVSYDSSAVGRAPSASVLPERTRSEWWAYFGADGKLASLSTSVTDEATGGLIQTIEWTGSELVYTDVASGETKAHAFPAFSPGDLRDQLGVAQVKASGLLGPADGPPTAQVEGQDTFVIERGAGSASVIRSYIARTDYREVKWERIEHGNVTESRATPVFEVLTGAPPSS